MPSHITPQSKYLEASQLFHWATKDQYNIWLYGSTKRNHRTESILPRLARKWSNRKTRKYSLFATNFGKKKVYSCPRRVRNPDILYKVDHGLGVTECLVRLWRSDMTAKVIEERFFYKCGSVPDLGLKYHTGNLLLVEYCSKSNFEHYNVIKNKLSAYRRNLWQIEEKFEGKGIILFVIDVPKDVLKKFVDGMVPMGLPVFFTDFESFKNTEIGSQLSARIYIWGEDGNTYPLSQDVES